MKMYNAGTVRGAWRHDLEGTLRGRSSLMRIETAGSQSWVLVPAKPWWVKAMWGLFALMLLASMGAGFKELIFPIVLVPFLCVCCIAFLSGGQRVVVNHKLQEATFETRYPALVRRTVVPLHNVKEIRVVDDEGWEVWVNNTAGKRIFWECGGKREMSELRAGLGQLLKVNVLDESLR